jgi:hypothetical protein
LFDVNWHFWDMNQEFRLSATGLQNIVPGDTSESFDFIIENTCYHFQLLNATFLSARLSRLRASDATVCEYEVKTPNCSHCFEDFLSLGKGYSVTVTEKNYLGLFELSEEFENAEIYSFLRDYLSMISESESESTLTISVAIDRLRIDFRLNLDLSKEVEFIASHLNEYSSDELRSLPIDCLGLILSNKSLKVNTEDYLCTLVIEFGFEFFSLFEFVHFEFVSPSIAFKFSEIYESCLDLLNSSIWKAICHDLFFLSFDQIHLLLIVIILRSFIFQQMNQDG